MNMPGDDKRKPSSGVKQPKESAKGNDREKMRSGDKERVEKHHEEKPLQDSFDDMFLRIKAKPFWPVAAATSSALRHDRFEKAPLRSR
jgi:hypothetical protein